jgi:hypothetical protein
MKILFITLFLLPILAMCQEEQEILNIAKRPTGLGTGTSTGFNSDAVKAAELLEQIQRAHAKPKDRIPAKVKVRTAQNLLNTPEYSSINQVRDVKEPTPKTKEKTTKLKEQEFINDLANELKRNGLQAKPSQYRDESAKYAPYEETKRFEESGVFEELGYYRNRDNDAIYNERLKWYGGMNSGFFMNIVGSFMETIFSFPQLIVNFSNLLFEK